VEKVPVKSLGIRCRHDRVCLALAQGNRQEPETLEIRDIPFPKQYARAEQLSWLRQEFADYLGQSKPNVIVFKRIEANARNIPDANRRGEVEGVLQAVAWEGGIRQISSKTKATLRRDIAYEGSARYVYRAAESAKEARATEQKEAVVAAWSGLP
jgi:hypothetical protein